MGSQVTETQLKLTSGETRNRLGGNGIIPGTGSHQDLVPLSPPFLILCWLHSLVAFVLFSWWEDGSQQLSATPRKKRFFLLTEQTEVPRLSLSGCVGVSVHLCCCHRHHHHRDTVGSHGLRAEEGCSPRKIRALFLGRRGHGYRANSFPLLKELTVLLGEADTETDIET